VRAVSYAVSIQFNDDGMPARLRVIEAMRTVGLDLLEYVH
jgi:beta-lactamase class A